MLKTVERNNQIVIELLKHHNIKKVVASPGGTNVSFIASIQNDPFFEIYSSVDERSAAYIACGLSVESGEPVVLSCTGATAARNYFPGLTEAYYNKIPILAITSTMPIERIGHNFPQLTDRTNVSNDIVKKSFHIPLIKDEEDEWACTVRANEAMLELKHNGSGPVHLNVETSFGEFTESEIKPVKYIDRITFNETFPNITKSKVGIFIGNHIKMSDELIFQIDQFCEKYNGVVIGDHTSNYKGKYFVPTSLVSNQKYCHLECCKMELLIHLGNISGAYLNIQPAEVWRVNEDGKICDNFKKLRYVFEMTEIDFFNKFNQQKNKKVETTYYEEWKENYCRLESKIPNLPYSNLWVAKELSKELPKGSVLHLGILNSLRSWNFFQIDKSINVYSNTGGFGIDGCVSTLLGASLANRDKLYFGVVGDLAFFYDLNSLGNRHFGNNVRLLVINNGMGQEFKNFGNRTTQFDENTNTYIAAAGHFGNKSKQLVKNYAENLGFIYISASSKEEFEETKQIFLDKNNKKSVIFEIFTDTREETEALKQIISLEKTGKELTKEIVKNTIGLKGVRKIKDFLRGK